MIIGVKYCGGCNPRYNRTGMLARIEACAPQHTYCPAASCAGMDALLVLNGCGVACADISLYDGVENILIVKSEEDYTRICGILAGAQ